MQFHSIHDIIVRDPINKLGALKRTAWHHVKPDLPIIETNTLSETFRSSFIEYLKNPEASAKLLRVTTHSELGNRVREAVDSYLSAS